eukprot:scaffold1707_cov49-Phaeocystis_antarctica.AAC.3
MHDLPDAQPGDGDSLGNCMQTKLTADSNVSGDTNVSTIKTDAVLFKPTTIDTDAMSTKPVGGTLAMLTNVDTLKEEPGPSKEKELGPSKEKMLGPSKKKMLGPSKEKMLGPSTEKPGGLQEVEPGAGAALADGTDVENLEDKVQVVITEDKVAGAEQARRPLLHPIGARLG